MGWSEVEGAEGRPKSQKNRRRENTRSIRAAGGDSSRPGSAPPLIRIHELSSYIKSLYDTWPLMQSWLRALKIKSRR